MNFEIEIALKFLDIEKILHCLNGCIIENADVIDNWNYDNQESLRLADLSVVCNTYIKHGRIIQLYGKINCERNCGMFLYMKGDKYICNLWFDCSDCRFMDSGCIDDENNRFYMRAVNFVLTEFTDMQIYYAAFGCELLLSEDCDVISEVKNSHNAVVWIIKNEMCDEKINGFYQEALGEDIILMKCGDEVN